MKLSDWSRRPLRSMHPTSHFIDEEVRLVPCPESLSSLSSQLARLHLHSVQCTACSPLEEMPLLASLLVSQLSSAFQWECGYELLENNFLIKHLTVLQLCAVTHTFLFQKCPPSHLLLILWHSGKTCLNLTKPKVEAPPLLPTGLWACLSPHTHIGLRSSRLFPERPEGRLGALLEWRRQVSLAPSWSTLGPLLWWPQSPLCLCRLHYWLYSARPTALQ